MTIDAPLPDEEPEPMPPPPSREFDDDEDDDKPEDEDDDRADDVSDRGDDATRVPLSHEPDVGGSVPGARWHAWPRRTGVQLTGRCDQIVRGRGARLGIWPARSCQLMVAVP